MSPVALVLVLALSRVRCGAVRYLLRLRRIAADSIAAMTGTERDRIAATAGV